MSDESRRTRIASFDELLELALQQPDAQRLLLVLLRAEPEDEGTQHGDGDAIEGKGTLQPVMATDREVDEELRLDALVEEADQSGLQWDLILVSSLSAAGGRMPTAEEADPHLKQMAEAVEAGADLSGFAVFDRAGSPVELQTRMTS